MAQQLYFPQSAVHILSQYLDEWMPDHTVVERRLGTTEPSLSIGVYSDTNQMLANSYEIGGIEPTLMSYSIKVQLLTKGMDREEMQALHTLNAKIIRAILYRTEALQLALSSLSEDLLGSRERFQRFRVVRQETLGGARIANAFNFLSTTDVVVETETVKL